MEATYFYNKEHTNFNVPTKAEYELNKLLNNENRTFLDVILSVPANDIISGNVSKCYNIINDPSYSAGKIAVSLSGGSDSDVVLDMVARCDKDHKVYYYFVNTGLESKYTKEHLDYLELKYQIEIDRFNAKTPIPLAVRKEGIPFLSKQVSEFLMRLERYGFEYDDSDDLKALCEKYCEKANDELADKIRNHEAPIGRYKLVEGDYYTGCVSALEWWCNKKGRTSEKSMFNISRNPYLKEFLIKEHGLPFKVANKCCKLSKKDTIKSALDVIKPELSIQGVRRAEGGARAAAYKNCFNDPSSHSYAEYRPVFWFLDADKKEYEEFCGVKHSRLYDYLKRTGCSGCPFGQDIDAELECFKEIEPNMYKAMCFVFGPAYAFTKKYKEFQKEMKAKEKEL